MEHVWLKFEKDLANDKTGQRRLIQDILKLMVQDAQIWTPKWIVLFELISDLQSRGRIWHSGIKKPYLTMF